MPPGAKSSKQSLRAFYGDFSARYRHDPVRYVREILRAKPHPYQEEWLRSIDANDRVTIRACHGPGKTACAAWALLWFLHTRPRSQVVVTGPTFERNIKDRFWGEINVWVHKADPLVRAFFTVETYHVRVKDPVYGRFWYAMGTVSDDAKKIEGAHAPDLLFIVDEAKTVERETFASIGKALTGRGDQKLLLISTPAEQPAGYFFDSHRYGRWARHSISAFEAQAQGADITDQWIQDQRDDYGEGSAHWQSVVLGEFPDQGERTLIPMSWWDAAERRHPLYTGDRQGVQVLEPAACGTLGLDVSEGGADATVAAIMRGQVCWAITPLRCSTSDETAREVIALANAFEKEGIPIYRKQIERTGPGYALEGKIPGVAWFVPGSRARDSVTYANKRGEGWWHLRTLFENGLIAVPPHQEKLKEDCLAMTWEYTSGRQRLRMPEKKDLRKLLGRSPDYGDALMIACYPFLGSGKLSTSRVAI